MIYDAIPSPLPPNLPSLGYEATSTTEFGDAINLAGTERFVTDVTVTMSAWALHSDYPGLGTPDGWTHPITLNIYGVDHGSPPIPGLGTPLKSVTQTFLIPWRPEADPTCPGGTAWRSPSDNQCYNGLAFDITFSVNYDATGNNDLIFGIVYNTADYGPVPIHAPGPYNSLNVALHRAGTDPAIAPGSDIEPDALFWNTSHVPFYTNPACLGGTFCRDTAWAPYSPAIRIRAVSAYPVDCPVDGKSTAECRSSAGVCDPAEACNGTDNDCPADAKSTAECRASAGDCDVAEICDGVGNNCPANGYKPTSFVCRVSAGGCDLPDYCPGNAASCTADAKSTAVCRAPAGVCDVGESCDGVNNGCPADGFKPAAVVCRPAAGPCDVTDYCPGSGAACTTDAKSTAVCRAAAGVCDVAESCSGTSDLCPPDAFKPETDVCRASDGVCDVTEYCAGGSSAALIYDAIPSPLPPNLPSLGYEATSTTEFGDAINLGGTERFVTDVTVTMSAWALHSDYPGLGTPDGWTHPITLNIYGVDHSSPPIPGLGTPLKSVTQTFLIPWRPEADPTCPGGTAWRSPSDNQCYNGLAFDITFSVNYDATGNNDLIFGIVYNTADYGPVPIHAPGPYNSLNVALHRAGTDPAISPGSDIEPDALFWNTSHVPFYTNPACLGGTFCRDTAWVPYSPAIRIRAVSAYPVDCPVDGKSTSECRLSAGVCDPAESCDGVNNSCPSDAKSTAVCRGAAGVCDVEESCNGTDNNCPADGKSTAVCRSSQGVCDVVESCNGSDNNCPADGFQPATVLCLASAQQCDAAENCTGSGPLCPPDVPKADGTPCEDGLYCSIVDTCQSGVCTSTTARDCAGSAALAVDFETPTYATGSPNGQDGWVAQGSAGSGCALYDHAIVPNTYGYTAFGSQTLRMSSAVTSGCFGDQTFSKPLPNEVGEETADNGGQSGGTRRTHFEAEWMFASIVPGAEQPGLHVVASPDRGDGARMSWVQMADTPSGLEVDFYDYQDRDALGSPASPADGCSGADDWYMTVVASGLSRAVPHTIKLVMDVYEGPHNDVVKIYVDGVLLHTGTTWEDYYRWCSESWPPQFVSRTVDSILFRTAGTANPATFGNGFLIDNLKLTSGAVADACNVGVCDEDANGCLLTPTNEGGACGSGATTDCDNPDSCASGVCLPNYVAASTVCATDLNDCTNDVCNGSGTCAHPPLPASTPCGSGSSDQCDNPDSCNGSGTCLLNHVADGTACNDTLVCTTLDVCANGSCDGGPALDCNDLDPCTNDSCTEPSGCQHAAFCGLSGHIYYNIATGSNAPPPSTQTDGMNLAKPIQNVVVGMSGAMTGSATTDATGLYSFTGVAGNLTVTPKRAATVANLGYITGGDATEIARYAVGLRTLSPVQTIAADVSNNGSVTSFDAAQVATKATNYSFVFPVAAANLSDFGFVPAARNYTPLSGSLTGQDYDAVMYGDVTGNWVGPANAEPEAAPGHHDRHGHFGRGARAGSRTGRHSLPCPRAHPDDGRALAGGAGPRQCRRDPGHRSAGCLRSRGADHDEHPGRGARRGLRLGEEPVRRRIERGAVRRLADGRNRRLPGPDIRSHRSAERAAVHGLRGGERRPGPADLGPGPAARNPVAGRDARRVNHEGRPA